MPEIKKVETVVLTEVERNDLYQLYAAINYDAMVDYIEKLLEEAYDMLGNRTIERSR